MRKVIAVECWADYYFFSRLLRNEHLVRKEKNKAEVIKSLKERRKDGFGVGIVDSDNDDIRRFFGKEDNLIHFEICKGVDYYLIEGSVQHIIELSPKEFELWLLNYLKEYHKLGFEYFGYDNLRDFYRESKQRLEFLRDSERFKRLINFILGNFDETGNNCVKIIKDLLEKLVSDNYEFEIKKFLNV